MEEETPNPAETIQQLQRCLNGLIEVLALRAVWTGRGTRGLATTLTEALVHLLDLDFAFVKLGDPGEGEPRSWVRVADGRSGTVGAQEVGARLEPYAGCKAPGSGLRVPNPVGEGLVSIVCHPLGLHDRAGVFIVGSSRPGFPTEIERLLLKVAASQAMIGLEEARSGERPRAQEALQTTEDPLREMADKISEVIWIAELQPEERVVYTSPSFERVWGMPLEDLYRNPRLWTEAIHPEDRDRIVATYSRWIAGDEVSYQDIEFRIVRPDGTTRWICERGVLTTDGQGKPVRASGISTDVTARRRAEEDLKRAFAEIETLKDSLQQENLVLREEVERTSMFEEIVGVSAPLRAVLTQVSRVAPTDATVLITGETGTGKELVARAIHKLSQRSARVLVSVNCAAIPPSLIASELFGHEKGAFTGALQRRQGRFELAAGGTIFLDEIGELPAETQVTLLRVLQEREFERVGGGAPIRADVRVIAASNRDLETAVAAGDFRADLFYRLNVFPIEVPPLRERKEDIPLLVRYFVDRFASKLGKKVAAVKPTTLELLREYPWPGNIRELQNVIERSLVVCESGEFSVDQSWLSSRPAARPESAVSRSARARADIEAALAKARGRVSGPWGAAAHLGMPPSTMENRIRSLGIDKFRFKRV